MDKPTDTPAKPSRTDRFARCSITRQEALPIFQNLPETQRTARGFALYLQGLGHKISHVTITRWFDRPEWQPLISTKSTANIKSPNTLTAVVHRLTHQAAFLAPAVYQGMQMAVIERLCIAMPGIKVETPEDFNKMLDASDRLRGLVHDARGDKLGAKPDLPEVSPPQVPGNVMSLGSFKKPNGNGAGNGAA